MTTATHVRIFETLATPAALLSAWRVIQKKGKSGGIDKVGISDYEQKIDANINHLADRLKTGGYVPTPYYRVHVRKDGNPLEFRPLSLPTIEDKIVQQALRQAVEPVFEPLFSDVSYAYRPGKGPVKAIERIRHIINHRKCAWAFCADIDRFFDTMDQDIALREFQKTVDEPEITKLLRMWMKIGSVNPRGEYHESPFGVAQGGIISPLLSNIYLHPLDRFAIDSGYAYVRYADNFILMGDGEKAVGDAFSAVLYFLKNMLKLRLNRETPHIQRISGGFTFMGIFFKGADIRMDRDRIRRYENRLRDLVKERLIRDPENFLTALSEKVEGFEHYYGRLNQQRLYTSFNDYLAGLIIDATAADLALRRKKPVRKSIAELLGRMRLFGERPGSPVHAQWVKQVTGRIMESCGREVSPLPGPPAARKDSPLPEPAAPAPASPIRAADRAVDRQKARYKKLESISREVMVESPGAFVGKNNQRLVVKKQGVKVMECPLAAVGAVNITGRGVTVSSDLLLFCTENRVPVFFCDVWGMPQAVVHSPAFGDARVGLLQLQALQDGDIALSLAREFMEGKIRNQMNLLKFYRRNRENGSAYAVALDGAIPDFEDYIDKIDGVTMDGGGITEARNRLLGYEAGAAKLYWQVIKILLADDIPDYPGRVRQGAKDIVNSLLNYGYGFLYRQLWQTAIRTGLNPKIGFLHTPQADKPVLVFDLIEEFRAQAVDRVVFSMLTKNEPLKLDRKTGLLTDKTRRKLVESLLERQGTALRYRGEKVLLKNIIHRQVLDLRRHLTGEGDYRCFIGYY